MTPQIKSLQAEVDHHQSQAKHAQNRYIKAAHERSARKYTDVIKLLEGKERGFDRQGELFGGES